MPDFGTDMAIIALVVSGVVGWVQWSLRQRETERANTIKDQGKEITELRLKVQSLEGRAEGHGKKLDEVKADVKKVAEDVGKIAVTLARMENSRSGKSPVTISGNGGGA